MRELKLRWYRWFAVLPIEATKELNLTFVHNVYGDAINYLNCRSIWKDNKNRLYRVENLYYEEV